MTISRQQRLKPDGTSYTQITGIERGVVFWVRMPAHHTSGSEQHGRRPWLIVSNDAIHNWMPIVQAVPLTSRSGKQLGHAYRIAIPQSHILAVESVAPIPEEAILQGDSIALTEQLRVLSHERLQGEPVAKLSIQAMGWVDAGILHVLAQ